MNLKEIRKAITVVKNLAKKHALNVGPVLEKLFMDERKQRLELRRINKILKKKSRVTNIFKNLKGVYGIIPKKKQHFPNKIFMELKV